MNGGSFCCASLAREAVANSTFDFRCFGNIFHPDELLKEPHLEVSGLVQGNEYGQVSYGAGVCTNVSVGIQYLEAGLRGAVFFIHADI
jgi:hypothetical protein